MSGLLRSSGRMGDSALLSHTLWRFTCRCGSVRSVGAGLFDLLACLFVCLFVSLGHPCRFEPPGYRAPVMPPDGYRCDCAVVGEPHPPGT